MRGALILSHSLALYHLPWLYEPVSALSHLLGAVVFLVLGLLLLRRARGDRTREIVLGIYAFSCVLLMTMSGVYHSTITGGAWNLVLVRLDHGAIFLLIAGTFTPIHGLLFRGPMRWVPLLVIWLAALGGIILTSAMFNDVAEWVGLTLYLVMGWLGTVGGVLLWKRYGFGFIRPLLLGGIAYSVGAVSEFFRWPVVIPGVIHAHEVFHIAVLVGAALPPSSVGGGDDFFSTSLPHAASTAASSAPARTTPA
ncbi:MAG TPA: hemolysin III family protein, partial [Tepidisphaeraceae bacterium]|nr:hemolysin III family protein [Tepidisphaeraceae bacterium]